MSHRSVRTLIKDLCFVAGSSMVSLLGFVLITSGRWSYLGQKQATFMVLFSQWEILTVTVGCLGAKDAIYAAVSKDHATRMDLDAFMIQRALPAIFLCSALVGTCFSWGCVPWLLISALLDVYAVSLDAELQGRTHYKASAVCNLTNYPTFFALLLSLSPWVELGNYHIMALFTATSALRAWCMYRANQKSAVNAHYVHLTAFWDIALQQGANYLLFRLDQLLVTAPFVAVLFGRVLSGQYLFLSKYPELVAGMVSMAGAVLFPRIYLKYPLDFKKVFSDRFLISIGSGYVFVLTIGTLLYKVTWKGSPLTFVDMLPFCINALLVLPVNTIRYSMLRQGYLRGLVVFLGYSIVNCIAAALVFMSFNHRIGLRWLVPLQMTLFLVLACTRSWGASVGYCQPKAVMVEGDEGVVNE